MKNAVITATLLIGILGATASAYTVNGDGSVTLEYGDSIGSVAADYDLNMYNLGYYNNLDADYATVQPGQTIYLGESSYSSMYGGEHPDYGYSDTNYYNGGSGYTDYYEPTVNNDWQSSQWYGSEAYNQYSIDYSYESNDLYYEGYTTATSDAGTYVDYGYVYEPESSTYYAEPIYGNTIGKSYVYAGYGDASGYNANLACQLNNEVIIPAGGTYSASAYLGDGGYGMGFIDSTCLDGQGGTFQAPGGGICSVTTAIHMAGKAAGLTVLQANPHNNGDGTTGVSYAAPEDQASFNAGTSDLVMVNPYDHPIKLNCSYGYGGISASFSE